MIFIFDRNETLRATLLQEEGFLNWHEARIEEELNGAATLELTVPYHVASPAVDPEDHQPENHPDIEHIQEEYTVVVKMMDQYRDEEYFREFVIKEIELDTEAGMLRAFCHDSGIAEMNDEKVEERRPGYGSETGTSVYVALESALEGSRWQPGIVEDLGGSRAHFFHESRMSCLQKIIEAWGAEIRFRVQVSGNQIVGRYVDVFAQRGEDRGKRIEIGKDLVVLKKTILTDHLKTAIWPRGKGEELESDEEDEDRDPAFGRRIDIRDVEWKTSLGDPVDKPKGQPWIGLPDALEVYGRGKPGQKRHKMADVVFEDIEDPEELAEAAYKLLKEELSQPKVSFDVTMASLESKYGHEAVRLGDWVRLIVSTVKPEIRVRARVLKRVIYLGEPERTEVTIGNFEEKYTDMAEEIRREVEERVRRVEPINWRNSIVDLYNNEIVASNAYIYMNTNDGMILYNHPRDQNPDQAMQMVAAGLRIANTKKPNGEWDWRTAITANGINADVITAGKMKADHVGAGALNLGGKDFGAAQLFLRDEDDNIVAHFDGQARSWDQIRAGAVFAPNVPRRTLPEDELSATSIYVHPSQGDDVEGDGTFSKPFRTLQRAVDSIPEVNHTTWNIRVIDPETNPISEHLEIRGFRGDGIIHFRMEGVRFTGWVRLSSNLQRINFFGGHYYHDGTGHPRTKEEPIATFHAVRTLILYLDGCYISAEQKALHAMSATYGSFAECYNSYFHQGVGHGVLAIRGSRVYLNNCGGRNNGEWGARASINGEIGIAGDVVNGKIPCPAGKGGESGSDNFFWSSTWTSRIMVPSNFEGRKLSGTKVTIPDNKILTAFATKVASWRMDGGDVDDGFGWHDGKLYQGAGFYPHTLAEGKDGYGGNNVGFVWFENTNFMLRLIGRTIKDIRVRIRRAPHFTADTPKEVQCWLHNYTQKPEEDDWDPTTVLFSGRKVGTYSWNEEKVFHLPVSAGMSLASGQAIGLAFYHEDLTQGLEIVPRSVVLEVVYE